MLVIPSTPVNLLSMLGWQQDCPIVQTLPRFLFCAKKKWFFLNKVYLCNDFFHATSSGFKLTNVHTHLPFTFHKEAC